MAPATAVSKTPPQSPYQIPSPTAKRYAFTPKAISKVPRAWERKPSTPFAPRNESQKIWKRYEFPDSNTNGAFTDVIRCTKTPESHALKKLRLGEQERVAYITSWDEELHETRHKQATQQDRSSIVVSSHTDAPNTVKAHNCGSPVSAQHYQEPDTSPRDYKGFKNEETADDILIDQRVPSLAVDPDPNYEEVDETFQEDAWNQGPLPDEKTAAQMCLEGGQDIKEQNADSEFTKPLIVTSPYAESCRADAKDTSGMNSSGALGEGDTVTSPARNGTARAEKVVAGQSIDRAAALQMNAALREALDASTRRQEQLAKLGHQPSPSGTSIAIRANGELEDSIALLLPPETEGDLSTGDRDVAQKQQTESDTSLHVDAEQQTKREASLSMSGAESRQDEQTMGLERNTTDNAERESAQVQVPPRQNPPVEAQGPLTKPTAFVPDDDTDYLHAFLTRAKAKKAAREASPQKVDRVAPSPMTRSRAALVQLCTNSPSPQKAGKRPLRVNNESEVRDTNRAGSPCRRSGRTRLPRPQKAPTVTPSTIPVRRSNGTEFVFLQGTDTAQVALATRTNTKRNKGEALVPRLKLQALSQTQKSPSKSPRPRTGKEVSWQDEPSYFGMQAENAEQDEEKGKDGGKPRTRKIRRLGAANGTPAPKRLMAEDGMDVRTPVSRKRGKVKP